MNRRRFLAAFLLGWLFWTQASWAKRKRPKAVAPTGAAAWAKLNDKQRADVTELWKKLKALKEEDQRKLRESFARFKKLNPTKQKILRIGLPRFARLTGPQKERFRSQLEQWKSMSPRQRREERDSILRGKGP